MRLRVLDVHAESCPHGNDECEHWDKEVNPGELISFTLNADIRIGEETHAEKCEVLTVNRDYDDNITIIVNNLDYQAKSNQPRQSHERHRATDRK